MRPWIRKGSVQIVRLVPAPKRAEILYARGTLLLRKEEFRRTYARDGEGAAETRGDVQEAIDMTYYMAGEGEDVWPDNSFGVAETNCDEHATAIALRNDYT